MVKIEELKVGNGTAQGIMIEQPGGADHPNMIVVKCAKGYVMCGYLNMDAAEKFGDAAVVAGGADFDALLAGKIKGMTSAAAKLGVKDGMTAMEAAELMNA